MQRRSESHKRVRGALGYKCAPVASLSSLRTFRFVVAIKQAAATSLVLRACTVLLCLGRYHLRMNTPSNFSSGEAALAQLPSKPLNKNKEKTRRKKGFDPHPMSLFLAFNNNAEQTVGFVYLKRRAALSALRLLWSVWLTLTAQKLGACMTFSSLYCPQPLHTPCSCTSSDLDLHPSVCLATLSMAVRSLHL